MTELCSDIKSQWGWKETFCRGRGGKGMVVIETRKQEESKVPVNKVLQEQTHPPAKGS